MAVFPDIAPDFGASKQARPRVNEIQFGSGYSQRASFGLNRDKKIWTLSWNFRTESEANQIEDFLEEREGIQHFDWSPPDETATYQWICKAWTKTLPYPNLFNINATFEQVFEP